MGGPPFNKTKDLEVIFEITPASHLMISGKIQEVLNLMLLVLLLNLMAPDQYSVFNVEVGAIPNDYVHLG